MRRTPAKDRALFLRERALELVTRQGTIERFGNARINRAVRTADFSICYADPETSDADQFHHLDIRSGGRKVEGRELPRGYKAESIGQHVTKEEL